MTGLSLFEISSRRLLSAVLLLMLTAGVAHGAPPHPDLIERTKTGEIETPYYMKHYDELRAKGIDAVDLSHAHGNEHSSMALDGGPRFTGEFRALAILVDFVDNPAAVDGEFFDSLVFSAVGSTVREYYRQISYDLVTLTTEDFPSDLGWQRAPQTYEYYVNGQNGTGAYPQNTQKLVEDLVELIDPQVDFSRYDNDGDGQVDGLVVIHAGPGAEYGGGSGDIWSHKWNISGQYRDDVYVSAYTIQPEYLTSPGDQTIGVISHELGHLFGLPDLYDTDYSSNGVGKWGIMSFGSWLGPQGRGGSPAHMCAWSKVQLGWLVPTDVTEDITAQEIVNVEENDVAYRLWVTDSLSNEYFLVANRQKTGFDSYLPSSGLLIWHVDDNRDGNTGEWYPGLAAGTHYQVALEQADGLYELEHKRDHGDAGDPFPGTTMSTSFDGTTNPNSDSYYGAPSSVSVENISIVEGVAQADLLVGNPGDTLSTGDDDPVLPDRAALAQNYPNPFNPSTTISFTVTRSSRAAVEVFDNLGRRVATVLDRVVPVGETSVLFDGTSDGGERLASGVYYYRIVTSEFEESKKMVLVR